ncbi:discoidin domain-containing protein, partial [Kitasatospora nipponensis]
WQSRRRRRRLARRRRGGRLRRLVTRLLVLALLVALAYGAVAQGPRLVSAVRDRFTPPTPVNAASVRASSEAPGHPAAAAVDGTWDHYWAPVDPPSGPPVGQWLEADFAQPFRLVDLVVNSGSSAHQDEFLTQARPADIEITAWGGDGRVVHKSVRLEDKPDSQTVQLPIAGVVRIRLTVQSTYGMQPGRLVALGEVEFYQRS